MSILNKFLPVSAAFITLVLLFGAVNVSAQISSAVPSTVMAETTSRAMVRDGAGNYYVTYSADYNEFKHIFVRKSSDLVSWQYWDGSAFVSSGNPEIPIELSGGYDQNKPVIEADSSNNIYVVWYGSHAGPVTSTQIRYSIYNGSSWSAPNDVTSGEYNQAYPSIAVDSSDNIHVAWYGTTVVSQTNTQIRYCRYVGGSWESIKEITTITSGSYYQGCPSIAVDSSNKVYIIWCGTYPSSTNQIKYRIYDGSAWGTVGNITSDGYHQYNPSIAVDSSNKVYAVWYGSHDLSKTATQIRYSIYDGSTWNTIGNITSGGYSQAYPSIAIDSSSNICAVWQGKNASSETVNQIRYSRYTGSVWSAPTDITSGSFEQSNPSFARGQITAVWQGTTGPTGVSSSINGIMACSLIVPSPGAVTGTDILDNGDGRDVQVAFNGSSDETNISEYRVILVQSKDAGVFNVDAAGALTEPGYISVPTSGNGAAHVVNLTQTSQDSSGTLIANGEPYKIFVLAVAKNGYLNKLASCINCLTLLAPTTGEQKNKITVASSTLGAMAKDNMGNYYAAYTASYNGYQHIFVRKSDDGGQSWKYWNGTSFGMSGAEVPIETSGSYAQSKPSIAVDGNDNLYTVWYGKDASSAVYTQIRYSIFDGNTWSAPVNITSGDYNQCNPAAAVDSSNNVYAVWYGTHASSNGHTQIRYSKYNGSAWSAAANITSEDYDQCSPSITIDSSNKVYAVWYGAHALSTAHTQIRYSIYGGIEWGAVDNITTEDYDQYNPSITVDSSDNIHAAWHGYNADTPTYTQIRYNKYNGTGWVGIENITSDNYNHAGASVTLDESSNICALWHGKSDLSTEYNQISYSKYDGIEWSVIADITSGTNNQTYPYLIKGEFTAAWQGTTDSSGLSVSSSGIMFYFSNPIAAPTASPPGGSYNAAQNVTLNPAVNAVATYYTLDGSAPDDTKTLYGGAINISGANGETITLRAVSYDGAGHVSAVLTQNYIFDMTAPGVPTVSPATDTYNTAQNVSLIPYDADTASMYYTLDGSEPDKTKAVYLGFIVIDGADGETKVLKAVAYDAAGNKSPVVTASYTFDKEGPDAPAVSPGSGTYNTAKSVELTPAGDADSTYYTLDGSEPDNTKTSYGAPITIDGANGTVIFLKAVSYDEIGNKGTTTTQTYIFDKVGPAVATAVPGEGIYNTAQSVELTPAEEDAPTYYTLDGSEPDNTKTSYGAPINIDGANGAIVTLKVVSYDTVGNKGTVLSLNYRFDKEGPAAPAANPAGGTYNTAQSVTLSLAGDAMTTYYTLDGSEPDNTKTSYNGTAINVDGANGATVTLKAVSYDSLGNKGTTMTASYTFDKVGPAVPTANPVGDTYTTAKSVTLDPAEVGVITYYTLDGSDPDNTKISYSGAINIDGADGVTVTLKAVSYDEAGNKGVILIEEYKFDKEGPAAPTASPAGDSYNSAQSVTLNRAVDAVSTYYTLDGSSPDNTKTSYSTAINIDGADGTTITLKAVSYDTIGNIGSILTQDYIFDKTAPAAPAVSLASGTYNTAKSVSLIPDGDTETIYYTLDGSDPDNTKTSYSGAILIDGADGETKVLKAAAYDDAGNKSSAVTASYTFDKVGPAAPTINPPGGTYHTAQNVEILSVSDAVYYTLDGSEPDKTKTSYIGAIFIDGAGGETKVLKAAAYDDVGNKSPVVTESYIFDKEGPTAPTSSLPDGTYNNVQYVTLISVSDDVYYTLDGSEPNYTKIPYSGAIAIDGADGTTITLKAVSYDDLGNIGAVLLQNYVFDKAGPAAPSANPAGGTYSTVQSVILTPAGDAVSTYYTLDESEPDNTKLAYTGAINIDGADGETVTLKVVSYDALGNKGSVTVINYSFSKPTNPGSSPGASLPAPEPEVVVEEEEQLPQDESSILLTMASDNGKNAKVNITQKVIEAAEKSSKNLAILDGKNKIIITLDALEFFKSSNPQEGKTLEISRSILDMKPLEDNELKPIGSIYEYAASVVESDRYGNETKRNKVQFSREVQVEFSYADAPGTIKNPNKLGIYTQDGSDQWIYLRSDVDKENQKIAFKTANLDSYAVMEYDKNFIDIPDSHWAKEYIDILIGRHITEGVDKEHFAPESLVTRAQFAAFIVKTLGIRMETERKGTFKDVEAGAWYDLYIETSVKAGIVEGAGDGTFFEPDGEITREEMTVMIMRAYEYVTKKSIKDEAKKLEAKFEDMDDVSSWARDSVLVAQANGIISGMTDMTFVPEGKAKRAQAAKMLIKLLSIK